MLNKTGKIQTTFDVANLRSIFRNNSMLIFPKFVCIVPPWVLRNSVGNSIDIYIAQLVCIPTCNCSFAFLRLLFVTKE